MRSLVSNSTVAEMQAVANALHIAVKQNLVECFDSVLIQTDCIQAITGFCRQRVLTVEELQVRQVVENITKRLNLFIEYRHVKGHSKDSAPRYVTNNLCDKRAKEHMRRLRDQILSHRNQNEYV